MPVVISVPLQAVGVLGRTVLGLADRSCLQHPPAVQQDAVGLRRRENLCHGRASARTDRP